MKEEVSQRPWGLEILWAKTEQYAAKFLVINAGESLSLQYHVRKTETLYLLEGRARVEYGKPNETLHIVETTPGYILHVPPGLVHRISTKTGCRWVEVSTPELEDICRIEDRYGRV